MTVELERVFQGPSVLAELLSASGSILKPEDVVERMRAALAEGGTPRDVIPGIFPNEPRFTNPELARALFGNLLGLWDLLQAGHAPFEEETLPPRRLRPLRPPRPPPFGSNGPDAAFVEAAWQYLAGEARERERFWHTFENRQDALLGHLDELELPEAADGVARYLLFELHAMLELGWGASVRRPVSVDLHTEPPSKLLPPAFADYIEESVFEAEQDEEEPLPPEQGAIARRVARAGLLALWGAGSE